MKLKSRNKSSKLIVICLIVSLLFITIGYSYIKTTLGVNGNVKFDNDFAIKKYVNILGKEMVAYPDNIASPFVSSSSGISISQVSSNTNGKGLYLANRTASNAHPIYYFRGGDATNGIEPTLNNNVLFANKCWKIVRTTDTGGVKLLYNGVPNNSNTQGKCANTGTASQIGISKFNEKTHSLAYVGYMYNSAGANYNTLYLSTPTTSHWYGTGVTYSNGTYTLTNPKQLVPITDDMSNYHYTCESSEITCSTVYYVYYIDKDKFYTKADGTKIPTVMVFQLTNGVTTIDAVKNAAFPNDSSRNQVNSTIKTTIDNWFENNLSGYVSKIEDTVFCNDRGVYSWGGMQNGANPAKNGVNFYSNQYISFLFACNSKYDRFTLKSSKTNYNSSLDGNQMLDYPVGLLDSNDFHYSGYGSNAYTFSGETYFSMSPQVFITIAASQTFKGTGDSYSGWNVVDSKGVRPSISLKAGTVASSGTGTLADPYVVN